MTPATVQLVQDSFKKIVPIAATAADLFYDRLFTIEPELRSLFPQNLSQQKNKLMQMLATAVTNLHQMEKILPAVQALGRRHVDYGVTDIHYEIVGEALVWTLEQGLGVWSRDEVTRIDDEGCGVFRPGTADGLERCFPS
jgi:hemoglobin-like flavoprotein